MSVLKIVGGQQMQGVLPISGAKNAALPLMITSLLSDEALTLSNMPRLADVQTLNRILGNHGVTITVKGKRHVDENLYGEEVTYHAANIVDTTAPYELVSQMRASFWVLGPLVGRMHEAIVSLPGGCAIGARPVDLHLQALKALGASIELEKGYVIAKAKGGLKGTRIRFPFVSVGATHQALMASVLAKGETIIENAACEPEVSDVAHCLVKMGAIIEGIGTSTLNIQGVDRLGGAHHSVVPDRIETGTFAMAAAMSGGDVILENTRLDLWLEAANLLREAGVEISEVEHKGKPSIRIQRHIDTPLKAVDMTTEVYPGFPTDLQAQFMALMSRAEGVSHIHETIFENRFMHVPELMRLGADIRLEGDRAIVKGVKTLNGAPVMATDLRASVSLVIGALAAQGETEISRIYHLDRGFENLEQKFQNVGVNIRREND